MKIVVSWDFGDGWGHSAMNIDTKEEALDEVRKLLLTGAAAITIKCYKEDT